ncbi:hypothetical protein ACP4OV_029187 [Aristida adscensionis]
MERRPLPRPRRRPRRAFRPPVAAPSVQAQRPPTGSMEKAENPALDREEAALHPVAAAPAAPRAGTFTLYDLFPARATSTHASPARASGKGTRSSVAGHEEAALGVPASADGEAAGDEEDPGDATKSGRASSRKGPKSGGASHAPANTPRAPKGLASAAAADRRRLQDQFDLIC